MMHQNINTAVQHTEIPHDAPLCDNVQDIRPHKNNRLIERLASYLGNMIIPLLNSVIFPFPTTPQCQQKDGSCKKNTNSSIIRV